MTIGDTVFVRWYGKIVEGMIVENSEVTPALASMVVVRIPVQGVRASALFTPDHVYQSAEFAGMKEHIKVVPTVMPTVVPSSEAKTDSNESELWRKLQAFKLTNWDTEHNHIKLSALNDFFDMWKEYVAKKCGYREYHPEANAYDGGPKPENYQQATDVVQQRMEVSSDKMAELESKRQKALAPAEPKAVKVSQLALWD